MGQRAVGRLGWGSVDTLDPAELTAQIPFLSTHIPASAFSGGVGVRSPIFQSVQINAQQQVFDVLEYPTNEDREAYAVIQLRNFPFFNFTDPQIKCYPLWMQIDQVAKPSPDEFVVWEVGVGVAKNAESFDFTMEPTPLGQQVPSLVGAAWVHKGAGPNGDEAIRCPTANIFGNALDKDDWNAIVFEMERFGAAAADTFADSAYFIGLSIQYATDFSNNAAWPFYIPP